MAGFFAYRTDKMSAHQPAGNVQTITKKSYLIEKIPQINPTVKEVIVPDRPHQAIKDKHDQKLDHLRHEIDQLEERSDSVQERNVLVASYRTHEEAVDNATYNVLKIRISLSKRLMDSIGHAPAHDKKGLADALLLQSRALGVTLDDLATVDGLRARLFHAGTYGDGEEGVDTLGLQELFVQQLKFWSPKLLNKWLWLLIGLLVCLRLLDISLLDTPLFYFQSLMARTK